MGWLAAGVKRIFEQALATGEPALYVSLHTGDPGTTGANEKSGDGYARVLVPDGGWTFPADSTDNVYRVTITGRLAFATPTGTYAAAITHVGLWDSLTAGTFYASAPLTAAVTPQSGVGLYFLANTVAIPIPTDD